MNEEVYPASDFFACFTSRPITSATLSSWFDGKTEKVAILRSYHATSVINRAIGRVTGHDRNPKILSCTVFIEVLAALSKGHVIELSGDGDQIHATGAICEAHWEHTIHQ